MKHQFHNEATGTVEILDDRYYYSEKTEQYYASVTTYLDAYPKGYGYTNWLKQVGFNADLIVKKAGEEGSLVHSLIEQYLLGNEITWYDKGIPKYDLHIWQMLLKFVDFWTTYKPEIIAIEQKLVSDAYLVGGRLDLVCKFNQQTWLIDFKSSNALYRSHELQTAAYCKMWEEINKNPIQRRGCLWLKSLTQGPDKTNKKIQGKGWQLVEPKNTYETDFNMFKKIMDIWHDSNTVNPSNLTLPNKLKLEK